MNIFYVDENPELCARCLDDKRLNKMILETAQMICNIFNEHEIPSSYKTTHKNHPSSVWVGSSQANFMWTVQLFMELCKEDFLRRKKVHLCRKKILPFLKENITALYEKLPSIPFTEPPKVLGKEEDLKQYDTEKAYRLYLIRKWIKWDFCKCEWFGVAHLKKDIVIHNNNFLEMTDSFRVE